MTCVTSNSLILYKTERTTDKNMTKAGPELEPAARLKVIGENAAKVNINPTTKATHYVRSGREMLRSAVNYHEDGSPEHAYTLYMRFLT